MTILQAIILAVVEGLTEFLPISSTGHLVLTANALSISQTEFVKSFEVIIQLGAILAVTVLYAKTYLANIKILKKLLYAFIPTGFLGFIFYPVVKDVLLGNTYITLAALFLGGIVLIFIEKLPLEKNSHTDDVQEITTRQAVLIGFIQSISMIPGVSRAGATIVGGLLVGLNRKAAVEFSFLLAVPTVLAASSYDLYKSGFSFTGEEWMLLGIGFLVSFIVAILAIKFFLGLIKHHSLAVFGAYRIILAVLYALFLLRSS